MNIRLIKKPSPEYFNSLKLKTNRRYYSDNYTLEHNHSVNRWFIAMSGRVVITDKHENWLEFVNCFDWQYFKVSDTAEFKDFTEEQEKKAFLISGAIARGEYEELSHSQSLKCFMSHIKSWDFTPPLQTNHQTGPTNH
jgi:hypothetical protein